MMTRAAIKKAFEKMDPADQAEMIAELTTSLARSMASMDEQDRKVFEERKHEESSASPLRDVKKRLKKARRYAD